MADKKMISPRALVHFADAQVTAMEAEKTLPAKFRRLLKTLDLKPRVNGANVGIKMHFGGGIGFTTIPPVFIRILVEELRVAGAKKIRAMDSNPDDGVARGYTRDVLGCEVISTFGSTRKYLVEEKIGFKTLDSVEFGGEALHSDVLIDLSHVKGHGACGFGGALKNIAMGITNPPSRSKLHHLEGGLTYDARKCTYCLKCFKECKNKAINRNDEKKTVGFFFHNCTFCQHCVMICPEKAIRMENRKFKDFAEGMALVTTAFLRHFKPEQLLFINVMTQITMYCDCWGLSTPALVPDIGILAADDIVAVETASLDLIKTRDLLPNGLPKGRKLMSVKGHLFEKIHGKDPYEMIHRLQRHYGGNSAYTIKECP
ncbi:MAG: DUF362 domain-containing protein [bacterium]